MPHETSAGTLTFERIQSVLNYDRETGVFRWKNSHRADLIGKIAGCLHPYGYRLIRVDGFLYRASRLAWLFCTGEWPTNLIDHIDGRRDHDAFANLRQATSQQNNSNKRRVSSRSGFKGVYLHTKRERYIVRIMVNYRSIHIGTFKTPLEAAVAYNGAALKQWGEFAKLNQV